jgi:hypothetical protein
MACDEDFAHRVRERLADEDAIAGKVIFGGLAFQLSARVARGAQFASSLPPKG